MTSQGKPKRVCRPLKLAAVWPLQNEAITTNTEGASSARWRETRRQRLLPVGGPRLSARSKGRLRPGIDPADGPQTGGHPTTRAPSPSRRTEGVPWRTGPAQRLQFPSFPPTDRHGKRDGPPVPGPRTRDPRTGGFGLDREPAAVRLCRLCRMESGSAGR